ncbi:MAG: AtpZ/AtpI family protein [Eubacterium sp.]|nr:AtpZ/AtpI family protein [Eubacterium sp.]
MRRRREILKNLSILTQLGLSLIMPVLLCLFLCWFLVSRAGLPVWIYVPGILFGLGGSVMTAYKFYKMIMKDQDMGNRNRKGFNGHL